MMDLMELIFQPWIFIPLIFPGLTTAFLVLLGIIWAERKIAAKVQMRYGPLYVLKPLGGAIQMIADLLRYLFAEPIIPKDVDKLAFIFAPLILFGLSYLPTIVLPAGPGFTAISSDMSLLILLGLLTLSPVFTMIMAWGSNNKFSLIGGLREGYLVTTYEIPLFLSALSMAVLYGTLDITAMVEAQKNVWGIFLNPLAAIVFLVLILISTSKFPFEIAEAESEIVMGPFTEYSGIFYGLVMGASYLKLYVLSLLYALMFLGGWYPLPSFLQNPPFLAGLIVFVKGLVIMFIAIFMRAVYPRYRIDQAIQIGWHKLVPLAILSIFLSLLVVYLGGV